ncbi:hypothetical protein CHU92_07760 [Flavobacterium cyanobacteriorum]|uniref:Peptidylprolyl isomerase n=1 Tax=Flavobacterium cyanobacteriorum TaxID=2022802 RepID=A0A255Z871_9FLAO|nr:hypothetical protein [Flavobacterium cyanobacteriorum]OYQ37646.1 hypothetical protein CHU92_07760 [Flavobacterium cyanobacteriorum]
MFRRGILFAVAALSFSCGKETVPETGAIARVNNYYLYSEDLKGLVPPGTSKQDSIAMVKSYIDRWASQKLLYDAAEVNLNKEKQEEYNSLVNQYRADLFTRAYLEEIVKRSVDTTVSEQELKKYYNSNKENFRNTGLLVKLRYIRLAKDHPRYTTVRSRFLSSRKADLKALNDMAIQFKGYAFNDTTWVEINEVYRKLPFINPENRDRYISSGISYQHTDSLDVYLVKVSKVLDKNQVSPYEYIKPTLAQLIINNRKLELIKKFEKEITDDAIKNDKYEVYK